MEEMSCRPQRPHFSTAVMRDARCAMCDARCAMRDVSNRRGFSLAQGDRAKNSAFALAPLTRFVVPPAGQPPASLPVASSSPSVVPWLQTTSRLLPRPPRGDGGGWLIPATICGFEMGVPRIEKVATAQMSTPPPPPCAVRAGSRRRMDAGRSGPVGREGAPPSVGARQIDAAGRAAGLLASAQRSPEEVVARRNRVAARARGPRRSGFIWVAAVGSHLGSWGCFVFFPLLEGE